MTEQEIIKQLEDDLPPMGKNSVWVWHLAKTCLAWFKAHEEAAKERHERFERCCSLLESFDERLKKLETRTPTFRGPYR